MANEKYSIELIQKCCKEYRAGALVRDLCAKYNIPRSTIYSWLERHRHDRTQDIQYKKRLAHLRAQHEKVKQINQVLKKVKCTVSSPLRVKLYELEKLHGKYSVRVLCEALEVDRGTFYNHIFRNKKQNTEFAEKKAMLTEMVREIYDSSRGVYGSDKILAVIRERGICTSVQTIRKIMKELGLRSLRYSAKKDYKNWLNMYETKNVLRRKFDFDEPNLAWVSDCTQFRLFNKTFYICAVMDLFSRKIIAYKVSERASTRLVTQTFKAAYEERQPGERLIFHSDQGCQYTSRTFRTLLRKMNVTQSFSKKGTPYDNSVIESFFSTLKTEELYRSRYVSEISFRRCLSHYMDFYNNERPHTANKNSAPSKKEALYEQKLAA